MIRNTLIALCLAGAVAARAGETLAIRGSNTFGEELGPRLIRAFAVGHAGVDVSLESAGTASGFAALLEGSGDIAAASRMASEDERRLARSRGIPLKGYTLGYYGVAVIVHSDNPLNGLSDRQVQDIFTGRVRNWKEVGGADIPITLAIRDAASGTHLGFREVAMANQPYAEGARMFHSYAEIAQAVDRDPGAIGYSGTQRFAGLNVKALRINGLPLNAVSVNEGLYPYARLLRFYTNGEAESPAARSFIRFAQSREGQAILEELGYVPRLQYSLGTFPGPGF